MIVHGYKEWGTGVLRAPERHVRPGDLGRARSALVVARDAMGIKLVYYRVDGGTVDVRIGDARGARRAAAASRASIRPRSICSCASATRRRR